MREATSTEIYAAYRAGVSVLQDTMCRMRENRIMGTPTIQTKWRKESLAPGGRNLAEGTWEGTATRSAMRLVSGSSLWLYDMSDVGCER